MTTRYRADDAELAGVGCGCVLIGAVALIKISFWIAVIAIAIRLLSGCGGPRVCPTQATRCAGERVELCDSSGQWYEVADCAALERTSGGAWACGMSFEDGEERNACLPAAEVSR